MTYIQELTLRNRELVAKIAQVVSDAAIGILLSGSNAWGGDYAVRADSDVDIIIIVDSTKKVLAATERLTAAGLVSEKQVQRADYFVANLYNKGVEIFSLSEGKISVDIIPMNILKQITELSHMKEIRYENRAEKRKLRIVSEFRSNPPRANGYTLNNLENSHMFVYRPNFYAVNDLGYVAQSVVDSIDGDYYMGVYAFFFSIKPVIIKDNKGYLLRAVHQFQHNIANQVGGAVQHVPREERMSADTLCEIKQSFNKF